MSRHRIPTWVIVTGIFAILCALFVYFAAPYIVTILALLALTLSGGA